MPEILVHFDEPISGPSGRQYFAQAVGHERKDGLWEGWLEFIAVNEDAPAEGSSEAAVLGATGRHGMKAMPCRSQYSRTSSLPRSVRL